MKPSSSRQAGRWWTLLLLFAAVSTLHAGAAAQPAWEPLPAPDPQDLFTHQTLLPEPRATLAPGDAATVEPDRLSVVRIQYRPTDAWANLRAERLFESATWQAALVTRPLLLRPGDMLLHTGPTRSRYRFALDADAPAPLELAVAQVFDVEPWLYWPWWQDQLHDWIDDGARDAPPAGLEIDGRTEVLEAAEVAAHLLDLVRRLRADEGELAAARHFAHALLLRAVQTWRRPRDRFYRSSAIAFPDAPTTTVPSSDTAAHVSRLTRGLPHRVTVTGPAVVRLGVRAVKERDRPDATSRFSLTVTERGRTIHAAQFTSRAALLDRVDVDEDEDEDDEAHPTTPKTEADNYVRAANGRVVGWRRTTQLWVPPGLHELEISAHGADVLVDGEAFTPRTSVEDAATRRLDAAYHVEQALQQLRGSQSVIAPLLQMEIASYLYRHDEAQTWHRLATAVASKLDRGRDVAAAWLGWREASWFEPDAARIDQLVVLLADDHLPSGQAAHLRRALVRSASRAARHQLAADLAADLAPTGSAARLRTRTIALMHGGADRDTRWRAWLALHDELERRPFDTQLRKLVQATWWRETFWDEVEPQSGVVDLQPIGPPDTFVATSDLRHRRSLLYAVPPGSTTTVWAPAAPDVPQRLHRLRLALHGGDTPAVLGLTVDGERYDVVRRRSLQWVDFAVKPGAPHQLAAFDHGVYATTPPEGVVELPADSVLQVRNIARAEADERATWNLPTPLARRFARLSVRLTGSDAPARLEIDDGVGAERVVFLRRTAPAHSQNTPEWVRVQLELPPGSTRLTVRPRGGHAAFALELRMPRNTPDVELLDVAVRLPPDPQRLERLRLLSERLAAGHDPDARIQRAVLLMSLDRDRLARVDIEHLLTTPTTPAAVQQRAARLQEALAVRLSSEWLEIDARWLDGRQSMPLDHEAAVVTSPADCPEPARHVDPRACPRVALYLAAFDAPPLERLEVWRELWERGEDGETKGKGWAPPKPARGQAPLTPTFGEGGRHLFVSQFGRDAVELIEADPDAAPVGLAAEAYGRMRAVMERWPSRRNRGRMYGAMRWTRWERVHADVVTTLQAEGAPWEEALNEPDLESPTMADPVDAAVEHAMLGQAGWEPGELHPVYAFSRRTFRFKPNVDAILELQSTCVDLRPDLQPEDEHHDCLLVRALTLDGESLPSEVSGSERPGSVASTRWRVEGQKTYLLVVERKDGLVGRSFVVRPMLHRSNHPSRPITRITRKRLDVVPPTYDGHLVVQGPVVVRVDLRGVIPAEARELTIFVDGEEAEIVAIPQTKEEELVLGDQRATRAVRRLLWLEEPRTYELRFDSKGGFAALDIALRVDDYDALLRPEGRGWLDIEIAEELPAVEVVQPLGAADPLPRRDLLRIPPVDSAAVVETSYQNRDELLLEDDQLVVTREGFLRALAGGQAELGDWLGRKWVSARVGGRTSAGSPVAEAAADAYWRTPWWRLRLSAGADARAQRLDGDTHFAGRGDLRVSRPTTLASDWLLLPSVETTLRLQPRLEPPDADPVIFSSYTTDHPVTFGAQAPLWYRPFLNAMLEIDPAIRLNPHGTLDQASLGFGARAMLQSTEVRTSYRLRYLVDDEYRGAAWTIHDLDVRATLGYWATRNNLFTLEAWVRESLIFGSAQPWRTRFGVGLTYWFSRNGLRDRLPSEAIYDDLLQPRYFE